METDDKQNSSVDQAWLTNHLGVITDEQVLNVKRNAMLALESKVEMHIDTDNLKITCFALEDSAVIDEVRKRYLEDSVRFFFGLGWECHVKRKSDATHRTRKKSKRTSKGRKGST
jgi:hypothetical protein